MSLLTHFTKKIWSCFLAIVLSCKRLLCFLSRRKQSDSSLPFYDNGPLTKMPATAERDKLNNLNSDDLQQWEWGDTIELQDSKNLKANDVGASGGEEDIDFFQDMQPVIKNVKVLVKPKDTVPYGASQGPSNKLAVKSGFPSSAVSGDGLDVWDDDGTGNAWEDEEEDLTTEADIALRETRRLERERRHLEHQRKQELRTKQGPLPAKGGFVALKLS